MGTFGKVLIVLNLLAMGAVAYLASKDWAKRQEWAFAALSHEIKVVGLPLEAPNPPPSGIDLAAYAPFQFTGESGTFTQIKRTELALMVPGGGDTFGSANVASQEEEVKRLEDVVFKILDGIPNATDKRSRLQTFLVNLAETGEERDGAFALLDGLTTPAKYFGARTEIPFLAMGPSQQSGLASLDAILRYFRSIKAAKKVDDSGPLREAARNSLIRLAVADLPYTVKISSGGSRQDRYNNQRQLTDARSKPHLSRLIEASLRANVTEQELQTIRDALSGTGQDDTEKAKLLRIGQLASNLLDTDQKISAAVDQIRELINERCESDAERTAMRELIQLLDGSVPDNAVESKAIQTGLAILRLKFALALMPIGKPGAGEITGKELQTESDKRTRIAHLLYHIDADQNWSSRASWQRRVASIVGIDAYTDAIEAQASRLFIAIQRVEQLILNEQGVFDGQYFALVKEAQYLADLLTTVEAQYDAQNRVVQEYQVDVNQRQGERDTLRTNLATSKANATKSLTDFNSKQAELVEKTKKLREAQDSITKLEADIRRLESEIKGKKQ